MLSKLFFSWFDALLLYPISKLLFDSLKKKNARGKKSQAPLDIATMATGYDHRKSQK